jgi:hypothetical protein
MSGGKTVSMVRFAYEEGLKGKKIISNIHLNFPENINVEYMKSSVLIEFIKVYYENSEMLKHKFFNTVVIADELVNVISSRKASSNLNEMITNWCMMISKLQAHLVYSFQMETQIDIRLRNVTNKIVTCFRFGKSNGKWSMIDPESRTTTEEIQIVQISLNDYGLLGKKLKAESFDPKPFFNMYDTFEMTLLDKTEYLKGGNKDLGKRVDKASIDKSIFSFTE